jgi:hypothetical protein
MHSEGARSCLSYLPDAPPSEFSGATHGRADC